jgi:hypothetical protein
LDSSFGWSANPTTWIRLPDNTKLAGHYKFDGDVLDHSGNNNNGTIIGNPTYTTGKHNQALSFNQSSAVNVGPITENGPITVTMWFNSIYTGKQGIIDFNGTEGFGSFHFNHTSNRPLLYLGSSNYKYFNSSASSYMDGNWHFLVLKIAGQTRFDINNAKLYIDNNEIQEYSKSNSGEPNNFSNIHIGKSNDNNTTNFRGLLDEVRIYNNDLSLEELSLLYNTNKASFDNITGNWR